MRTHRLEGRLGLIGVLLVAQLVWPVGDLMAQGTVAPTVTYTISGSDLTIQSIVLGCPSSSVKAPLIGTCNMVTVVVKNAGTVSYSQPVEVRLTAYGAIYQSALANGLAANQTGEVYFKVSIGTAAGYVSAVVDAANKLTETNNSNNTMNLSVPAPTQSCPKA